MLREEEDHVFWAFLSYDGVIKEDLSPIRLDKAITSSAYALQLYSPNSQGVFDAFIYPKCLLHQDDLPCDRIHFLHSLLIFYHLQKLHLHYEKFTIWFLRVYKYFVLFCPFSIKKNFYKKFQLSEKDYPFVPDSRLNHYKAKFGVRKKRWRISCCLSSTLFFLVI